MPHAVYHRPLREPPGCPAKSSAQQPPVRSSCRRLDLPSCTCREGEDGDNFWMIESGIYKAVKQASQDEERLLFRYEGKGAFGELALMYNCPRAATVVVSSWPPAVVHSFCKGWCMPLVHLLSWAQEHCRSH